MNKKEKFPPQQSDITIDSEGKIHISFLWDDLLDLTDGLKSSDDPIPAQKWEPPRIYDDIDLNSEYLSCKLCPKECGFDRLHKKHLSCGDSKLRVSNFGITHGDEFSIRGTRGSGAIMLSGCPLKCVSCHNPEKVADGIEFTVQEFIDLCANLYEKGAHNIQILSPTVHFPVLRTILRVLKDHHFPIPIIFKSSGYESIEQLKSFAGLVDVYVPDFKFGSCSQWGQRAGVKDYFDKAGKAVHEMISQTGAYFCDDQGVVQKGVLIRHVEAPLPAEEKKQIREFLSQLQDRAAVSFQDTFVELE